MIDGTQSEMIENKRKLLREVRKAIVTQTGADDSLEAIVKKALAEAGKSSDDK